jgi:hypothetical protein
MILTNISEEKRLGIEIKPSQVRLNPGGNEPYLWKILPEKQEQFSMIFSKSLSDHSISAYRELSEGVGVTFEAMPSGECTGDTPESKISVCYGTCLVTLYH